MISEDTKKIIENSFTDDFIFEYNTEVTVNAAKRKLRTYFVSHFLEEI